MTVFVRPNIVTDPATLAANAKAFLEAAVPGWHPAPEGADQISAIIDAYSFPAGEQAEALELELVEAFKGLGPLVGVPPVAAQAATALVTFTLATAAPVGGFAIPIFSEVGVRAPSGELQAFRLVGELVIASGLTTGTATVEAVVPGEEGNNLSGAALLISTPLGVASASLATSGGGVNEEEEQAYLERLTESLAILKPGPVLAADAAVIARKVAGVFRATAVDNLKPGAGHEGEGAEETKVEGCITVVPAEIDGTPCTLTVMEAVRALLESLRESGMRFFVVKPQYEKVDVSATVFAWPGQNLAQIKAEVQAAIEAFLSPARYGTDSSGNRARWKNDPVIRQGELYAAIATVVGVRWCSSVTFAKHGGALSTANVTLGEGSAVPALPEPGGTITITAEPTS